MSAPAVDKVDLAVVYDGEALADHRMSVRDLAPALLGLADVFQDATEALAPGQPPVSLDIRATDEGSFLVQLAVMHREIVEALTSPDALALSVLVGFVTGTRGVLRFFRERRRSGVREDVLPDGAVRITRPDGTVIEFPLEVLALARRPVVRKGVRAIVEPLSRDGIRQVEVRSSLAQPESVTILASDLADITSATAEDEDARTIISEAQFEIVLTVTSPNFQPGNKWRLDDGSGSDWFAIEDTEFLARVDSGEIAFRSHDRLRAVVRYRQWVDSVGDIHPERTVLRVVRHIPYSPGVQGDLLREIAESRGDPE